MMPVNNASVPLLMGEAGTDWHRQGPVGYAPRGSEPTAVASTHRARVPPWGTIRLSEEPSNKEISLASTKQTSSDRAQGRFPPRARNRRKSDSALDHVAGRGHDRQYEHARHP